MSEPVTVFSGKAPESVLALDIETPGGVAASWVEIIATKEGRMVGRIKFILKRSQETVVTTHKITMPDWIAGTDIVATRHVIADAFERVEE